MLSVHYIENIYYVWNIYFRKSTNRELTLKHRETHGCVVSIVATDDLVLKHQVISILNAD